MIGAFYADLFRDPFFVQAFLAWTQVWMWLAFWVWFFLWLYSILFGSRWWND
jgi:hypothetical protein